MAYKLTTEQKEVANFIRSFNRNLENAFKSFGAGSEIYRNLVSFAGQNNIPLVNKSKFGFFQGSQSKATINSLLGDIANVKDKYYMKDKKTIKSFLSTGEQKEIATRIMKKQKKQGNKITLKTAYNLKQSSSLIAGIYKDAISNEHTEEQYEEMYEIMAKLRNDEISTGDFDRLKELSEQTLARQKYIDDAGNEITITIDVNTGEVIDEKTFNNDWIDIF